MRIRKKSSVDEPYDHQKSVRFTIKDFPEEVLEEPIPIRKRQRNALLTLLCRNLRKIRNILHDWLYLAFLGIIVACISIFIDQITNLAGDLLYYVVFTMDHNTPRTFLTSFVLWVFFTTTLVIASALFVRMVSAQAIGSGIPEMKTIIRGVILKDYLTMKTLISKIGGLCMSLSSGLPIGKCGPLVHLSSIVADQLSRLAAHLEPSFGTESRRLESLAAACAVGVASTFSAPVGGVLFSIEVTTMYFSVQNYWRGFFASCCAAITFRLLRGFLAKTEVTVSAFYQTSFTKKAFVKDELIFFALLGVICGLLGAVYIVVYKRLVLFLRNNSKAKLLFQRYWFVYPILLSVAFAVLSYPHGLGQYFAGRIRLGWNLRDFFSDCSFKFSIEECSNGILERWRGENDVLVHLSVFLLTMYFSTIICQTLPIPCGIFGPTFVIGAAMGRLQGELMMMAFPDGFKTGYPLHPGVYAVVGAASFSAAVTHSVSVSVMIFEITGQLHLILPVMIATIIANAICSNLTISWFDVIIQVKHLPFLPDIPPSGEKLHSIVAEDIMVTPVLSLTRNTTFEAIHEVLFSGLDLNVFPVVESKESEILLGSVTRRYLLDVLEDQIGEEARKDEADRRIRQAIETIDQHFRNSPEQKTLTRTKSDTRLHETTDEHEHEENRRRNTSAFVELLHKESVELMHRFTVKPSETPSTKEDVSTNSLNPRAARRNALFAITGITLEQPSEDGMDSSIPSTSSYTERPYDVMSLDSSPSVLKAYKRRARRFLKLMCRATGRGKMSTKSSAYDLTPYERESWEQEQLQQMCTIPEESIDPAPFHLVRRTTLHKVHSIFSMLQLSRAYVIDCGRIIGVVSLSDVRRALEATLADIPVHIPERKASHPHGLIQSATLRIVPTKVHDVLTPTLEVVEDVDDIAQEQILGRKDSLKRKASIRLHHDRNARTTMRKRTTPFPPHESNLEQAVGLLRRYSLCTPSPTAWHGDKDVEKGL